VRIGVNCYLLQANMGGMKQYFFTLFRHLFSSHPEHSYVFFYYPHNIDELEKFDNDLWRRDAVLLGDQPDVLLHLDKFDLYFCPFGALWPRPIAKPSVVMIPDIQETRYPEFFTADDLFQRDWHFRGSTRIADLVITISEFSRETLVRHHGISREKIRVIYPAADPRYYDATNVARAPACELPPVYAFYPANRWRHKNHDALLQALSLLKHRRGHPIHMVFTGYDVPNGYSIADHAKQLGVSELVHQAGYLHVEELAYLYQRARLLVFPSLYEGFGIPLVEAMAAGCPIACANETSLPEIAMDAARFFDPTSPESIADTITEIWSDTQVRSGLMERGSLRANAFGASRLAREHVAAFEAAAHEYSPGRHWRKQLYERYRRRLVHTKRALDLYSRGAMSRPKSTRP
jgi:glycosyltransferase involved in cell wall biosynthesis